MFSHLSSIVRNARMMNTKEMISVSICVSDCERLVRFIIPLHYVTPLSNRLSAEFSAVKEGLCVCACLQVPNFPPRLRK